MVRKRDYIAEILDVRTRAHKRSDRWQQFTKRNEAIIYALRLLIKLRGNTPERIELLKYVSIGTVACVEAYFRMAFRDLIDSGPPYSDNARRLHDMKLDISTLLDMGRERVSHGELIAHLLPLASLEDINKHMSCLLDTSFPDALKTVEIKEFGKTTMELAPDLFKRMKLLFRHRHVYCHEIAMKTKPTFANERRALAAAIIFVNGTEKLIAPLISK